MSLFIKKIMEDLQEVKDGWETDNSDKAFNLLQDIIVELSFLPDTLLTMNLDTESIVELLKEHATDWSVVLYFIQSFADANGYEINSKEIYNQMKEYYLEEDINAQ